MLSAFFQRLDLGVRRFVPLVTVLAFIFLGAVRWPVPYAGAISPSLGLAAVYYWSIHRPDLFHPVTAFACGLLYDLINFLPFGLTAIVYIGVHQLVLRQRRFFAGQTFYVLWAGFALVALLASAWQWMVVSVYNNLWVPVEPVALQFFLTLAVFPLPAWLLIRLQRVALSQG